jgi:hypothetical protein
LAWTIRRESNGYISSRVNLSSLAGQNVRFRFRIGTDSSGDDYGWFIDDVRVYTCGGGDTTRPKVNRTAPVRGARGVARIANVRTTFSEAMNARTINGTTFKLKRQGATTNVRTAVDYDAGTRRATLNPNVNLAPGATYIATVTIRAKDRAGNSLDQDSNRSGNQPKTWKFRVTP